MSPDSPKKKEFDLGRYSPVLFTISTIALILWLALITVQSDTKRLGDARSHALLERFEGTLDRTATLSRSIRGLMEVQSGVTEETLRRYLAGIDAAGNYKELLSISILQLNPDKKGFSEQGIKWSNESIDIVPSLTNEAFKNQIEELGMEALSTQRIKIKAIGNNFLAMTEPFFQGTQAPQLIYSIIDIRRLFEQWIYDISTSDIALSIDETPIFTGKEEESFAVQSVQEKTIFGRRVQIGVSSTFQYTSLNSQALIMLVLFQLLSTALLIVSYRTQNRLKNVAEEASSAREDALTAERAARNAMERALRVKDEFLNTVSHELRSPLNAILGWAQLLLRSKVNEEQMQRGLTVIERNVHQQTRLIEDLLDLSRSVSGKLLMERKKFMLHHLVEDQVEQATFIASPRNITLEVKRLEPILLIGDEKRFQQIVGNLLNNAIKFSNQGGTISVSLEIRGTEIRLEVEDDGIGIGSGYLSNLFDKFQQQDSTTTRQYGGLGIGLSIVKLFTELHGGKVWGESTGKGEGSRFVVTVPYDSDNRLASVSVNDEQTVSNEEIRAILSAAKILVVDDEEDAREVVTQILKESGALVVSASSVETALSAFNSESFDAIVSDIGMPGEDGFSLARKIRDLPKGKNIALVALSALARLEDKEDAVSAGFDDHVSKPLNAFELTKKVVTYIVRHRTPDEVHSTSK